MVKPHGSLAVGFVKKEGVSRPFGHYRVVPTNRGRILRKKLIYLQRGGGMSATLKAEE
jgi:hypothetical protein